MLKVQKKGGIKMKEYLVLSYEGTVLIKHIPNNVKSYDKLKKERKFSLDYLM